MKNLGIALLIIVGMAACNQAGTKDNSLSTDAIEHSDGSNEEPKFEFKETKWDFGRIKEGERVEHSFKFVNTGDDDLVISNVTSSCGCTAPDWPRGPIKPGEESKIKVEFNSAGKKDLVTKDVTIFANTNPVKTTLQIQVFVEK
ncbi:MAG: DUF1573 domain-containing protein [Bacteroidia bacterium]